MSPWRIKWRLIFFNLGPQKIPKSLKAIQAEIEQIKAEIDYLKEKENELEALAARMIKQEELEEDLEL